MEGTLSSAEWGQMHQPHHVRRQGGATAAERWNVGRVRDVEVARMALWMTRTRTRAGCSADAQVERRQCAIAYNTTLMPTAYASGEKR
jgi:hypothetical protein